MTTPASPPQIHTQALGSHAALPECYMRNPSGQRGLSAQPNYEEFLKEFKLVFGHPDQGRSSSQKLLHLCQGPDLAADYAILSQELQLELACQDADLDGLISLLIKLEERPDILLLLPEAALKRG